MRHFLSKLVAAVFVVGLALGMSHAGATPRPTLNGLASQASPVEKRHYGYPRYNYWRPYYRPYYYGYGYRPYWNYGYWNRPYYHRRYW
jgi:hypothetical protein